MRKEFLLGNMTFALGLAKGKCYEKRRKFGVLGIFMKEKMILKKFRQKDKKEGNFILLGK
ncbi:hypothetical protein [Fructobacillus tropaeoli]|jgi:hypothetical protein|uniref:hypothetical protein n=1 Tax=Fructobacillus tropaeoli TaxID=709323 RepID=UPI0019409290|nr:hypothetical protein [Fructobacillus tropaeoli]GIC70520.1 hypothetical protein FT12353_11910 [Fructobacillus tropaeoli]